MNVQDTFDALVSTLTDLSPEAEVLVAAGRALAVEIDDGAVPDDKGKTRPVSAAVTALRGLVDDLLVKGRARVADPGEAEADGDWSAPCAVADLAAVRDAAKPGKGNARARGGGGRKAAG